MAAFAQPIDGALPIRLPDIFSHLQRLNQKFALDNSADSGFEIEKIRSASALTPNALEHVVDPDVKIDMPASLAPGAFSHFHKILSQRPHNRAGASQCL